jgi:hypothetical protein
MADVSLAFLWHQHQPYYPDDLTGENPMPWVRLHGVKDYYGMLLHLMEFPAMRCSINLVPSLIEQILQYTEQGRSDRFLDVSRINADNLEEAEAVFLLDNFFMDDVRVKRRCGVLIPETSEICRYGLILPGCIPLQLPRILFFPALLPRENNLQRKKNIFF